MSDAFICGVCGKTHTGLQTDEAFALPDDVWAIPKAERGTRAKFDTDLCQYGDRHFIRCWLGVPFTETSGHFGWGVWVEVEPPVFWRYVDLFVVDGSNEPRHAGHIANCLLPVYEGSLSTQVFIQFGPAKKRPSVYLPDGDRSVLAREQKEGIDSRRYHEILDELAAGR